MKWYANKNLVRRAVDLLFVDETNGRRAIGQPMQLVLSVEKPEDAGLLLEPTLSIPYEAAESLLQALWDEGFRPNGGEGSSGHVAALKAHISFAERVTDSLLQPPSR